MKKVVIVIAGVVLFVGLIGLLSNTGTPYTNTYETEEAYERPAIVNAEGEFDEEAIKTMTSFEYNEALSEYEEGSEEALRLAAIWEGYNIGLGHPINDASDLLTAWDNVTYLSQACNLTDLAAKYGDSGKHEEKLYAFLKKTLREDLTNNAIDDSTTARITNTMAHISNASILSKAETLESRVSEYLAAKEATSGSSLTSAERSQVEEAQYFNVYVSSRVRNSGYVEVAGYGVNDEYLDLYTCFIDGEERIIVSFIDQPPSQGYYSGYFRYTGEDKYTSSDGFERNLANYKEVSAELVDRYYEDSENRNNAETNLSNAKAKLESALQ